MTFNLNDIITSTEFGQGVVVGINGEIQAVNIDSGDSTKNEYPVAVLYDSSLYPANISHIDDAGNPVYYTNLYTVNGDGRDGDSIYAG